MGGNNGHRSGVMDHLLAPFNKDKLVQTARPQHRVALCIAASDMVRTDFALSLAALCYSPGAGIALVSNKGPNVLVNLNQAVLHAQQLKVTHLLFLHGELTFPLDTLRGLLQRDKDIVGATFVRSSPPYDLLGKTLPDSGAVPATGLHEVEHIPMGLVLVRMSVFEALPRPWFQMPIEVHAEGDQLQAEEVFFCRQARDRGFKIWLDVDLTNAVGNLGQHSFRVEQMAPAAPTSEPPHVAEVAAAPAANG